MPAPVALLGEGGVSGVPGLVALPGVAVSLLVGLVALLGAGGVSGVPGLVALLLGVADSLAPAPVALPGVRVSLVRISVTLPVGRGPVTGTVSLTGCPGTSSGTTLTVVAPAKRGDSLNHFTGKAARRIWRACWRGGDPGDGTLMTRAARSSPYSTIGDQHPTAFATHLPHFVSSAVKKHFEHHRSRPTPPLLLTCSGADALPGDLHAAVKGRRVVQWRTVLAHRLAGGSEDAESKQAQWLLGGDIATAAGVLDLGQAVGRTGDLGA